MKRSQEKFLVPCMLSLVPLVPAFNNFRFCVNGYKRGAMSVAADCEANQGLQAKFYSVFLKAIAMNRKYTAFIDECTELMGLVYEVNEEFKAYVEKNPDVVIPDMRAWTIQSDEEEHEEKRKEEQRMKDAISSGVLVDVTDEFNAALEAARVRHAQKQRRRHLRKMRKIHLQRVRAIGARRTRLSGR